VRYFRDIVLELPASDKEYFGYVELRNLLFAPDQQRQACRTISIPVAVQQLSRENRSASGARTWETKLQL
jgi:hypothetical protein